ncbi:DMSO/TMAO reductase YedYZ molybdopterin-dependent catalytic subunit [Herbihabitans rhizosphaerae]|uniref:DMSO/TMAO reductase YedYZ molybdopterin-dependent catalytic subunit n=1 Tax=Herbihabitans rhizosphaerae TaxID=1872711 RepID=A0A4Q7KDK6_9PSEU|nr:molybdopterin-dependent oxidoreductase [Herbihabitans rhizosphaerae]RZS29679.1 DMSO/TMAO reductase YedYZ molybdopterin-dependent catalytic subunit [Herbihabitans rhizosphaerae]
MRFSFPVKENSFRSAAHDERVTARIGMWLGIAFTVCFVTGLLSHAIQHPPSWFFWPSRPVWLYQVTQGLHVIAGVASIPLLVAKLWSVYPKLFGRPVVRSAAHALERASILVLSGAAFFELVTGLFNVAQNYPFQFFFPPAHYAVAWVLAGSIVVHVAVKLPVIRRALGEKVDAEPPERGTLSRRGFLRSTWLASGVAVVATAGATVPLLRKVSGLSWRAGDDPQGLPVNRTAFAAGVHDSARDPAWRLEIGGRSFTRAELEAMPQITADLPIACVEGWSESATWTGVPVADVLRAAGLSIDTDVRVISLERNSLYAVSTLPAEHVADPLTLLALRVNGETLNLDHGFPCRIIAPNRPGVLQTKWVHRLEVVK